METPLQTLADLRSVLAAHSDRPWVVAYSGGKDSSLVLKLVLTALRKLERSTRPKIEIVYCDTGVEGVLIDRYVKRTLAALQAELDDAGIVANVQTLQAPLSERFFVKIIGRGYPPPNTFFRWCTKSLRIKPVSSFLSETARRDAIVLTGMRLGESEQRDRFLSKQLDGKWLRQSDGGVGQVMYCPIVQYSANLVWDTLFAADFPRSINHKEVWELYRDAAGECPTIREPQAAPCSKGRFGCWTCTVVRKDRSTEGLIAAGHTELAPYLRFRNWLNSIRNDPVLREPLRRTGRPGPGPFTLAAREKILAAVNELEVEVGRQLISDEERAEISRLWSLDRDALSPPFWMKPKGQAANA